MNNQKTRQAGGIFWPTLSMIAFMVAWFSLCGAGFWYLLQYIEGSTQSEDAALKALQAMTWPFAAIGIAGPAFMLVSIGGARVVRDLLHLHDLLRQAAELPDTLVQQVGKMNEATIEMRTLRSQMLTDFSRANEVEVRQDDDSAATSSASPQAKRFWALYEAAKVKFYESLEEYNGKSQEPQIVRRGGGNFNDITRVLENNHAFSSDSLENSSIADFLRMVFTMERSTRLNRANLDVSTLEQKLPKAIARSL